MRPRLATLVCALVVPGTGCTLESGNLERQREPVIIRGVQGPRADASPSATVETPAMCDGPLPSERRDQVCYRWTCDRLDADAPVPWSGDASACVAGEIDAASAARALRFVNLHRFLAGSPPVALEPAWTAAAQECALVAHANALLSHTPGRSSSCWSEAAAAASAVSLIANRSVSIAIDAFVEDPGNEATMVHRRWLLAEELVAVGFGSTDRYACVVVDGHALTSPQARREARARRAWVAWPPPGPVPLEVITKEHLDAIGWTVQSSTFDLDAAAVTVTESGTRLPVHVEPLAAYQGSRSAVRIVPDGWRSEAGRSYAVRIGGSTTIDFVVEPVDCTGSARRTGR